MLGLSDKKLKTTVIVMLKKLKETMFKKEESLTTVTHQIENINQKFLFFHGNFKVGKYSK